MPDASSSVTSTMSTRPSARCRTRPFSWFVPHQAHHHRRGRGTLFRVARSHLARLHEALRRSCCVESSSRPLFSAVPRTAPERTHVSWCRRRALDRFSGCTARVVVAWSSCAARVHNCEATSWPGRERARRSGRRYPVHGSAGKPGRRSVPCRPKGARMARRTHVRIPVVGRVLAPVGSDFVSVEALGGVYCSPPRSRRWCGPTSLASRTPTSGVTN